MVSCCQVNNNMLIVNKRHRRRLAKIGTLKFDEFTYEIWNQYISKGRILGTFFLMNLPLTNKLWSETSEITNVFCRGHLMSDSNVTLFFCIAPLIYWIFKSFWHTWNGLNRPKTANNSNTYVQIIYIKCCLMCGAVVSIRVAIRNMYDTDMVIIIWIFILAVYRC